MTSVSLIRIREPCRHPRLGEGGAMAGFSNNGFIRVLMAASGVIVCVATAHADIDWRSKGAVTPVQNQGAAACNNSWAFAVAAIVEGAAVIQQAHGLPNLAEQQLVDCVSGCTNPPAPGTCP